jgi:hypothetical protein
LAEKAFYGHFPVSRIDKVAEGQRSPACIDAGYRLAEELSLMLSHEGRLDALQMRQRELQCTLPTVT